jgi:hypothetical protein
MANREACEVYFDQEIEHGLKDGKTPYSIGKELSTWIVKLFEVKIQPSTIEKRAQRQQQLDFKTNVLKQSDDAEKSRPDKTWESGKKGGKREGAGRIMFPPHLFPFK